MSDSFSAAKDRTRLRSGQHLRTRSPDGTQRTLFLSMQLHGSVHPEFLPVARALARQLRRGPRGGAAVCVYHRGEKVVDLWGGVKDAAGNPWVEDTMSVSFS